MAVIGDTLPHCTGTGVESNPYIFTTPEGFLEAIDVVDSYIEAGQSNLTFDFNSISYSLPITIKCASLDAKGLTLFNLVGRNGNYDILAFAEVSYNNTEIKNLNVYNFCIIVNSNSGSNHLIKVNLLGNSTWQYATNIKWYNCHFAGCVMGRSNQSSSPSSDSGVFIGLGYESNNFHSKYFTFENCTFNIHLKDKSQTVNTFTFVSSGGYERESAFKNCTICISGDVPYKFIYISGKKTTFDTVVFTNSSTNQLRCRYFSNILYSTSNSGYNYYKAYITTVGGMDGRSIYFGDTLGLVNRSRMTAYSDMFYSTGIVMQEDDSTASDYIYDNANLAAAGFLVGDVIS